MQAITTKFISATNYKPSRIKASAQRGSVTVEWDHALNIDGNHKAAIDALIAKFVKEDEKKYGSEVGRNPWARPYVMGETITGYVAVYLS